MSIQTLREQYENKPLEMGCPLFSWTDVLLHSWYNDWRPKLMARFGRKA